jgi:hypothetical protein
VRPLLALGLIGLVASLAGCLSGPCRARHAVWVDPSPYGAIKQDLQGAGLPADGAWTSAPDDAWTDPFPGAASLANIKAQGTLRLQQVGWDPAPTFDDESVRTSRETVWLQVPEAGGSLVLMGKFRRDAAASEVEDAVRYFGQKAVYERSQDLDPLVAQFLKSKTTEPPFGFVMPDHDVRTFDYYYVTPVVPELVDELHADTQTQWLLRVQPQVGRMVESAPPWYFTYLVESTGVRSGSAANGWTVHADAASAMMFVLRGNDVGKSQFGAAYREAASLLSLPPVVPSSTCRA